MEQVIRGQAVTVGHQGRVGYSLGDTGQPEVQCNIKTLAMEGV